MSNYKLGILNLPESDVILVRTLLRLFPANQFFSWKFSTTAPYDAILIQGNTDLTNFAEKNPAILRLVGFHDPEGPDRISRPIRPDRLKTWLDAVGEKLSRANSPGPTGKAPIHTKQNIDRAPLYEKSDAEPKNMASESIPGFSTNQQKISPDTDLLWPTNTLFNLHRWPPATLLRRDPARIRMASLLARRALNLLELSQLSGQSIEESQKFLNLLNHVGLLDVTKTKPSPPAQNSTKAALDQKIEYRPSFGRHLITGIRKRLGIGMKLT